MAGRPFRRAVTRGPSQVEVRVRRYYLFQMLVAFQFWSPFWTLWLFAHADYFQSTLIDVVFWIVSLLVAMPAGAFADRYGRKRALLLGVAIWILGIALFGLATEPATYALSNGIWAFGAGFLWGAGSAYLYDTLVEVRLEARYPAMSGRVAVFSFLGTALASVLGGLVVAVTDRFDVTLLLYAVPGLGALAVGFSFREPTVPRAKTANLLGQVGAGLRSAGRNREILLLIVFQVAVSLVTYVMGFFRPRFIDDIVHGDYAVMGLVYGGFFCVAAFAGLLVAGLLERFGEGGALATIVLLVFPPFALVYAVSAGLFGPGLAFGLGVVTQLSFYLVWGFESPVLTTILNRRVASAERATVLAIVGFFDTLVIAVAEPIVGFVANDAGYGTSLAVLAFVAAAPAAYAVLAFRRIEATRAASVPSAAVVDETQ